MQILHIDCSPRQNGRSRLLSLGIVNQILTLWPQARVIRRDIGAYPLPLPDAEYAALLGHPGKTTGYDMANKANGTALLSEQLICEIEAADVIVLGTPVHNFTVPAALKSWIDHVVRVNRTVALGPDGKKGLLQDRPVLVGFAAGGFIQGDRAQQPDFFTPYLTAVFGCIGLHSLHFVPVQGTAFEKAIEAPALPAPLQAGIRAFLSAGSCFAQRNRIPAASDGIA